MCLGHTRTGFRIPKTPGSSGDSDSTSATGRLMATLVSRRRSVSRTGPSPAGCAARTIDATWRQRTAHTARTAATPVIQSASKEIITMRSAVVDVARTGAATSTEIGGIENGWPIVSASCVICGTSANRAGRHPMWLPALTSIANGTKNLSDAASQSP